MKSYEKWKSTLTDSHWSHIGEAILNDEENTNVWAGDHDYLIDIVKHYGGTEDFAYYILEEEE